MSRWGFAGEIITETQSRTTRENARQVLPLLDPAHCIAVASNPLHGLKLRLHLAALDPGLRQRFVAADDILTEPVDGSGYNEAYGLLRSNKSTEDAMKLFPRDAKPLVLEIQKRFLAKTGK